MTPESADLLARLEAFQFEPGFVGRLAHENGWPLSHAQRACLEYKRFVFLALAAGHPCAPSDAVDQVWHLHVLHTQDYWEHFCGRVLRAPLHHQPARGAAHEGERFRDWYQNTLASYRRCFGAAPPSALWPAPSCYLDGDFQRVDRRGVWLIPKPRWLPALARAWSPQFWLGFARAGLRAHRWPQRALVLVATSLAVAGCSLIQQVPPFDLRGPSFLLLFLAVWAVSLLVLVVARGMTRSAAPGGSAPHPYELAYLVDGEWQVAQAVMAALVQNDQLRVDSGGGLLLPDPSQSAHARGASRPSHPLELAVLARCAEDGARGTAVAQLKPVVVEQSAALAASLQAQGLLYHEVEARLWLSLALLAPLLGLVKIGVGLAQGKPVLYLVLLCAVAVCVAWYWLGASRQPTQAGRALLDSLRRDTENTPSAITDGHSMAMMVALFGAGALAEDAFADIRRVLAPRKGSGDSSDSSSNWGSWGSSTSGDSSSSSDSSSGSSCSSSDSGSSGCSSGSSSGCGGCSSSSS